MREVGARPRVLHDDGLPARQIARGPVADPGVLELHEEGLGAAPLAPRALDVGLIALGGGRDLPRVADAPAVALEEAAVRYVAAREQERELERLGRQLGERHVLEKGHSLVIVVADFLPILGHLDPLA